MYVILFGVGEVETEGIYTLKNFEDDDVARDTVLVFEDKSDAVQYAIRLDTDWTFDPHVCSTSIDEILAFCSEAGYAYRLEGRGTALTPPVQNVQLTDWERYLRLKRGDWQVLEADPTQVATMETALADPQTEQHQREYMDYPEHYQHMPLDDIR